MRGPPEVSRVRVRKDVDLGGARRRELRTLSRFTRLINYCKLEPGRAGVRRVAGSLTHPGICARIAVKSRPVICAISSIVLISPWNRTRAFESSPSNFIPVEGSSCAPPTRIPFRRTDDPRPGRASNDTLPRCMKL